MIRRFLLHPRLSPSVKSDAHFQMGHFARVNRIATISAPDTRQLLDPHHVGLVALAGLTLAEGLFHAIRVTWAPYRVVRTLQSALSSPRIRRAWTLVEAATSLGALMWTQVLAPFSGVPASSSAFLLL